MNIKVKYILLLVVSIFMIIACSKDQLDEESLVCEELIIYDDVRNIISKSCGYTDCHNGLGSLDNYNNFAGIENHLNSGSFATRVFAIRDMPPSYAIGDPSATPIDPDPTSLTEEEIDLLKCWEQNGFSEF